MPHKQAVAPPVPRRSRVRIPQIDFRHAARDPIGAGLGQLAATLQAVSISFEGKERADEAAREAQNLKQAEVLFSVIEQEGVELDDRVVIGQLKSIFGREIGSQAPEFIRKNHATRGRIFGKKQQEIINDGVANGQFATVAELDEAYSTVVDGIAKERGQDRDFIAGFFEVTEAKMAEHRATVLQQQASNDLSVAKANFSTELRQAYDDLQGSNDPDAFDDFQDTVADTFSEMRAMAPDDLLSAQEVVANALLEIAQDPSKSEGLDEYLLAANEVVTDPAVRARMAQIVSQAEVAHELRILEASPAERLTLRALMSKISVKMSSGATAEDRNVAGWIKEAQRIPAGAGAVRQLLGDFDTVQKGVGADFGKPTPEQLDALFWLKSQNDIEGMYDYVENLALEWQSHPLGRSTLADMDRTREAEEDGKLLKTASHRDAIRDTLGSDENGWTNSEISQVLSDFISLVEDASPTLNNGQLRVERDRLITQALALRKEDSKIERVTTGEKIVKNKAEADLRLKFERDALDEFNAQRKILEADLAATSANAEKLRLRRFQPGGFAGDVVAKRAEEALAEQDFQSSRHELAQLLKKERELENNIASADAVLRLEIRKAKQGLNNMSPDEALSAAFYTDGAETVVDELLQ